MCPRPARPLIDVLLLCSLLLPGCTGQRDRDPGVVSPPPESERPPPAAAPPYVPPPGAVLSVLTHIGANAPAGVLQEIGLLQIRVRPGGGPSAEISLPVGGSGILPLPGTSGSSVIEVTAISPAQEVVASNAISMSEVRGAIGVLALEIATGDALRGCLGCSAPDRLVDLPPLHDTAIYWSAGTRTISENGDVLHVGIRAAVGVDEATGVIERAGGTLASQGRDDQNGLVWWMAAPADGLDGLDLALALASRPEVKVIEVYREDASGAIWVDR